MKTLQRREIKPILVVNQNGKLKTDSLTIAKVFDKEHKNIMRDIRNITESDVYKKRHQSNFELMSRLVGIGNNAKRSEPLQTV